MFHTHIKQKTLLFALHQYLYSLIINCLKVGGKYIYKCLCNIKSHSLLLRFVWLSEYKPITSLTKLANLVFVMDMDCVLCEVGSGFDIQRTVHRDIFL